MRFVLASASPRRKELLKKTGWDFQCIPSDSEEVITESNPADIVKELSFHKALDVYQKVQSSDEDVLVVGADTIVVYKDEILEKPIDEEDAFNMLSMLSDRTHQVFTGVTIMMQKNGKHKEISFAEKTEVSFYKVDREDIQRYVDSKDPLDKAGAYGIQGDYAIHVKKINGDYNNVVGLPLGRVYHTILDMLYSK